jgi:hypothetical protein
MQRVWRGPSPEARNGVLSPVEAALPRVVDSVEDLLAQVVGQRLSAVDSDRGPRLAFAPQLSESALEPSRIRCSLAMANGQSESPFKN